MQNCAETDEWLVVDEAGILHLCNGLLGSVP